MKARVTVRTPLLYESGADETLDRPSHVRAGSALVAWPGHLAVVQDDARFLAIVDRTTGAVRDLPFPGTGPRQFDELRGNKKSKLDLEAAFAIGEGASTLLVALGSGSSPLRERVVLVDDPAGPQPRITVVEAPDFYAMLRADVAFSGSELNLEGAVVVDGDLLLFQRGNGAPSPSRGGPVDATARIEIAGFLAHVRERGPLPPLRAVTPWVLHAPDGQRVTFTDGARTPDGLVAFLACAEASPDVTRDGPVTAVVLGRLDERTRKVELGPILDERGEPFLEKAEGLAFDPEDATRVFVVTDKDDPSAPCELLELRLEDWSNPASHSS